MNRLLRPSRLSFPVLLALLAAGCATGSSAARTAARPAAPPAGSLALKPYVGGLFTVEGEVAGRRLPFLFDTAGGVTLLTVATAKAAGCVPYGHDVGFRHDGRQVVLERCAGVALALGSEKEPWRTRDAELAVFDLSQLLGDAPEVGGLVSLASFAGERITIDLPGGTIVRETPASLARRIAGAAELRIRPGRQAGGAALDLFVAVDSPRGPLWFELDSGSTGETLIAPHAAALLGLDLPPGERRTVALPVRGTPPLAPIDLPVRRREELIYDGLISIDFFERFVVTLDLAEMRAWVRPRAESAASRPMKQVDGDRAATLQASSSSSAATSASVASRSAASAMPERSAMSAREWSPSDWFSIQRMASSRSRPASSPPIAR